MINAEFTSEINDLITENLYQWDTYQTLKITGINFGGVAPRIHFANKKSTEALVVNAVLKTDGSVEVSIPNTLLAEKYDILAYIYTNTGLTSKTIKSITIPIIARLKPSEYYQPSDEDIAQIEAIELEAKAIIDGLTASEYSSTETYKRPNIVYYQLNAYMCISNDEITGVPPTDTSKWQKICSGAAIVSVSVNSSGNLVFTDSNGFNFVTPLGTDECELVDFPASNLTKEDVEKVKKLANQKTILEDITINRPTTGLMYDTATITKPGLYAVVCKLALTDSNDVLDTSVISSDVLQTIMISIYDLNCYMRAPYLRGLNNDSGITASSIVYNGARHTIETYITRERMISVKLILEY